MSQYGPYSQAWSYSSYTDITTPGSTNQYSAITGNGESSDQYGVCNVSEYSNNRLFSTSQTAFTPTGAYFTNTTYAALSMQDGDAFATQFGDVSNSAGGEDWFLLTIYGLASDSTHNGDSVNFYLADYRFTDNTQDYIIDDWTWVDLSSLESVYGLDFVLSSSDIGTWGMNTPAYFAMDNFDGTVAGIESSLLLEISAYPNPTNGELNITGAPGTNLTLHDINGRLIKSTRLITDFTGWNISELESGIYILTASIDGFSTTKKIIKK